MNRARWEALVGSFGAASSGSDVYAKLVAAYSEPHRHYHTAAHVDDCLTQLDQAREIAAAPHEVELALWFHDAVYEPASPGNEAASAAWAREFLRSIGVSAAQQSRVYRYILATKHDVEPEAGDQTVVVDVDLSILGRGAEEFDLFERNIRSEYEWVPDPVYRRKRVEVLEAFLKRPAIYGSEWFRGRYETQARRNLQRTIQSLREQNR